jgi:hypothetical protein
MRIVRLLAVLAALLPALATASAHDVKVGSLTLSDLWTRAIPPGAPAAAGYLAIANSGAEPDRLIAVSTPLAESSELHVTAVRDGVASMRPLAGGIGIAAGGSIALAPGGMHIMFMHPGDWAQDGDTVPVTLTFQKAGTVETFLHVLAIGAPGPTSDSHAQHVQ